jgi:uncharacterized protein YidB (DUF937 family)
MGFFKKFSLVVIFAMMGVGLALSSNQATLAQGGTPAGPGGGLGGLQIVNACVTGDFTGAVTKALGISAAELRKDVVNGQSLSEIAQSKNVDYATVAQALMAAVQADVNQGVADGIIPQTAANAMSNRFGGVVATPAAGGAPTQGTPAGTPPAPAGPAPQALLPDIGNFAVLLKMAPAATPEAGRPGLNTIAFGAATFNVVRPYEVVAQAVNMKCYDLVKTLVTPPGKSVSDIVTAQSVDPKAVSDALTKAYQDALAQDVTDGIITQAQSDQLSGNLSDVISAFVGATNPMRPAPRATQAG